VRAVASLLCGLSLHSLLIAATPAATEARARSEILAAYKKLGQQTHYLVRTQGISGATEVNSEIKVSLVADQPGAGRFHIQNRGAAAGEIIITPEGNFSRNASSTTDAPTQWMRVPMDLSAVISAFGPRAHDAALKLMQRPLALGAGRCPSGRAVRYQFEYPEPDARSVNTLTVDRATGLPCEIRVQRLPTRTNSPLFRLPRQTNAAELADKLDTTSSYDYLSAFDILAPLP
jgi:hypothetical protein